MSRSNLTKRQIGLAVALGATVATSLWLAQTEEEPVSAAEPVQRSGAARGAAPQLAPPPRALAWAAVQRDAQSKGWGQGHGHTALAGVHLGVACEYKSGHGTQPSACEQGALVR